MGFLSSALLHVALGSLGGFPTGPWAGPLLDCGCEELEPVYGTLSRSAVEQRLRAYLQRHRLKSVCEQYFFLVAKVKEPGSRSF